MSQLVPGDGSGLKYLATTGQLSEILAQWCDEDIYIINPICGSMSRTCPEVSKNSWHLYVSHMLFEIDLLSLYVFECGVKFTSFYQFYMWLAPPQICVGEVT